MEIDFEPFRAIVRRLTPLVHRNREYWTEAVYRWSTDPPEYGDDGILPIPLPVKLTRDEGISLLAAIYDACVTGVARINPWRDPLNLPCVPRDSIRGEYQPAIRYSILLSDRVPNLRAQWETHEATVEMFVADVERDFAHLRTAFLDREAVRVYQLGAAQLLRALEYGNDDEALHTGLLQHIDRIREAANRLQLPSPLQLTFDLAQLQAGDNWAELIIRFPSGYYQKSATTFVRSPEELVIDAKDGVSIALKQWCEQLAQMEKESTGGAVIEQLPVRSDQADAGSTRTAGFLGGTDLANALGIHIERREAFFRQLERQRLSLGDESWHEVREPRPNSPRFLYRANSPKLLELATGYKTPKPA